MRQPQDVRAPSDSSAVIRVTRPAPPMYPASVPNSSQLPRNPRRRSGAYSAMKVDAPAYSPPVENPCTSRAASSSTGAQTPIVAYDGIRPMANVPAAIRIIVRASTFCRPTRSPSGPKTMPPSGRTRNAAAKAPKVESNCAVGLPDGKKTLPSVTAM